LKVAIFSDVHSNLEAYRASLLDMARRSDVEALWCLGDVVGYGAEPEECLQITAVLAGAAPPPGEGELEGAVAALAGKLRYVVLGNHDAASFGDRIINFFNATARRAAQWTADRLSSAARLMLQNFPTTATEDGVLLVHASPLHPREFHYINSIGDAAVAFAATEAQVIFCGHTHKPVVVVHREGRPVAIPPRDFGLGERSLVNVGSVGQPRDGDPRACYVLYDSAEARLEFVRVPYDVEAAADKIRKAGLPRVLADRLYYGW